MDPWSIAAVVGLIFAGKKFSSDEDPAGNRNELKGADKPGNPYRNPRDHAVDFMDPLNVTPDIGRPIGDIRLKPKNEIGSLQDVRPQLPFGMPVYTAYNRENISNKMNNLNPGGMPVHVGPGLGVGSNVSAVGGFQQFFRVLPNNPNDERLIQLKGNMGGPVDSVVKNGETVMGDLTQFPHKTYTHDPVQSRAGGQGGALTGPESRPEFTKTLRKTIRDQTGSRDGDNLEFGVARYNVPQAFGDMGGARKLSRSTDNRSNPDRAATGGRMNVTGDPESRIGLTSNLRRDLPTDHMGPPAPGPVIQQRYVDAMYYDLNELKSQKNPTTERLSIAKDVLVNNPYAISLST